MAEYLEFTLPRSSAKARVDRGQLTRIGVGGLAEVYRYSQPGGPSYALKLYRQPDQADWPRANYLIQRFGSRTTIETSSGIAWPLAIVEAAGKPRGIVLPLIGSDGDISLDWWVEQPLVAKLPAYKNALSSKLLLLKNLAGVLADLHADGIAVVDLKPSNILIRNDLSVVLLDADSFGVRSSSGTAFKPTHVSASYIAPEAYSDRLDVGALWHEQDRYAFAVIAFQVLNYGVHPFQCQLESPVDNADTNDDKAKLGLYAYGLTRHPIARPIRASVHAAWPTDLRLLFDRALTAPKSRPTLGEWRDAIGAILEAKSLARCAARPDDPKHIRFDGLPCAHCIREKAHAAIIAESQRASSARPGAAQSHTTSPITGRGTPAKPGELILRAASAIVGIVLLALLSFFFGSDDRVRSPPLPYYSPPLPTYVPPATPAPAYVAPATRPPASSTPSAPHVVTPVTEQQGAVNRGERDLGVTNAQWRRVQAALSAATGQRLQADGVAGPNTRSTIVLFQRRIGLPDNGELDLATLRELRKLQSSRLGYQIDLELPLSWRVQRLTNGEYIGSFRDGLRDGVGRYNWNDGSIYIGEFRQGLRSGFGQMTYNNRVAYEGEWKAGNREGQGIISYPNGASYSGLWEQDLPHGFGTFSWPDGAQRSGLFVEGCLREGGRVLTWAVRPC